MQFVAFSALSAGNGDGGIYALLALARAVFKFQTLAVWDCINAASIRIEVTDRAIIIIDNGSGKADLPLTSQE